MGRTISILFASAALAMAAQPVFASAQDASGQTGEGMPNGIYDSMAAKLQVMCSEKGAFQFAFGQTGVPGSSRMEKLFSRGNRLPESYAPFTHVRLSASEWSDRLSMFGYNGEQLPEQEAAVAIDSIDRVLTENGWDSYDEEDPPMYIMIMTGGRTFTREIATENGSTRLFIGLDNGFGEFTMSCAREDMVHAMALEAFGQLPDDAQRPVLEPSPLADAGPKLDCKDPAVLDDIRAKSERGEFSTYSRQLLRRSNYYERLMQWKSWRLKKAGADPERLIEIAFSALDAGPGTLAGFDKVRELLPLVQSAGENSQAGDWSETCSDVVAMNRLFGEIDEITRQQWDAMDKGYDAEASRLGIELSQ